MLGGLLYLTQLRNVGAAFSFAEGATVLFSLVAVAVAVVIVRTARRLYSTGWAVTLGLVLGGAVGNLIDRIFRDPGLPARGRGRLPLGVRARRPGLAGVQRGRLGDRLRRHPRRAARAARHRVRRLAAKDRRPATADADGPTPQARAALQGPSSPPTAGTSQWGRDQLAPACTGPCPVPDGLEGQRVDQALSRLFGLSRTAAAEVADAGGVVVDGRARGKGDRLTGGSWLEVELPPAAGRAGGPAPGRGHDDPVRRRRPRGRRQAGRRGRAPEPRLGRPDRHRRAWPRPGYRISTSGAAERQGVVHRLDAATTGRDGGRQERARLHRAQGGVQGADGRRRATTRWSRATPIRRAAPSTPRSTGTPGTTGGSPSSAAAGRRSPTTR